MTPFQPVSSPFLSDPAPGEGHGTQQKRQVLDRLRRSCHPHLTSRFSPPPASPSSSARPFIASRTI
jgi:hypothetical protein